MAIPRPDNGTGWVYMNSNKVYLNATEISHLSDGDAKIALYEMYARYGCTFAADEIQEYFESLDWYQKGSVDEFSFDASVFNDIEKWNVDLLRKEAEKRNIRKPGDPTRPAGQTSRPARPSSGQVSRPPLQNPSARDPRRPR